MLCRCGTLPTREENKNCASPLVEMMKIESIQTEHSYKDALLFAFVYQIKRQNMLKKVKPIKSQFRAKS